MPEIKIKSLVSFSSEDKIHVAENILKSETYRKWKCASPGEKSINIVLQFEKPSYIHSIDIGNESSAFIEVLVSRSSIKDFQVLLVASSFMSPLESRNETHPNRVRMFGPDKLAQNLKDEKWDCVQVVCTQPFNKNITYGLSFIKFHSPPEKHAELPSTSSPSAQQKNTTKLGAFKLRYDDDDDEDASTSSVGSWLQRKNNSLNSSLKTIPESPEFSYRDATDVASSSQFISQVNPVKRKADASEEISSKPPAKRDTSITHVNRDKIGYTDIMGPSKTNASPVVNQPKKKPEQKGLFPVAKPDTQKRTLPLSNNAPSGNRGTTTNKIDKSDNKVPFNKILDKVVFVISGFVNPLRGEIRDKALEMGAKYKGDWDNSCTHLVCAFANTPKYLQVKSSGGRIVTKLWIMDCHRKRAHLPWRKYMLGVDSKDSTEDESDSAEEVNTSHQRVKQRNPKVNGAPTRPVNKRKNVISSDSDSAEERHVSPKSQNVTFSPKNNSTNQKPPPKGTERIQDDSETEDEEAIQDYMANTDVESGSSGNDTEGEIRKVENRAKQKNVAKLQDTTDWLEEENDDSSSLLSKPDTTDLPIPQLVDLFKKRHFYLYGNFSAKKRHDLQRYITAYNGIIDDYMIDTVKYVITESKWDQNFEEALNDNEDIIFVKPEWIFKCRESAKLVPYQPYIIIPNS